MAQLKEFVKGLPLFSLGKNRTVAEAVGIMSANDVGAVLIMEDDRLLGIFTERDLIKRVLAKGLKPEFTKLEQVMSPQVLCATLDEEETSIMAKMERQKCRHIPVMEGNRPVGIISIRDLMRRILSRQEESLKLLEHFITSS